MKDKANGWTEEISVVSLRPERGGGSLSVAEGPKVTTEVTEAGPTVLEPTKVMSVAP